MGRADCYIFTYVRVNMIPDSGARDTLHLDFDEKLMFAYFIGFTCMFLFIGVFQNSSVIIVLNLGTSASRSHAQPAATFPPDANLSLTSHWSSLEVSSTQIASLGATCAI